MKHNRLKKRCSAVALNVLIAVLAILWLVPVFWLVVSSFRAEQGAYTSYLWPKGFTLNNYVRLFTDRRLFDFPRWFGNTMLVAGCSCVITTILTLMVAYVYSRLRFPRRKFLMNASLVLGMFPGFMSMIAIYHFMKAVSLDQTLLALILVYSGGAALNYYIAKGYFDTIPKSLDEAAILDGATNRTIFWKIILPNSKPVIATTAINAFINPIVDYIFVSVIMKDNYNNFTVAKGLYTMVDKTNIYEYYTVFCAGAVIVAIPVVLLFIRMQKYYVAGVVGGSVKGYQNIAFENPHMFEIISGITSYLDKKDYALTLKPLSKQDAPLYIRDIIQQRQADALILHAYILSTELAAILARTDFPYLVIGKPAFRCSVSWIDVNHEQAGQLAANFLLDKGYRRMAFITGSEDDSLSQSRLAGINQVMAEEELTVEVIRNQSVYTLDDQILHHLLTSHPRPEVLLCNNNHLALHCLQQIRRLGLKIPEDIGLLTFDNYPFSMLTDPAITAVEVDMHEMGIGAARFVLQRIRKPNLQTQSYCTSPSILERAST